MTGEERTQPASMAGEVTTASGVTSPSTAESHTVAEPDAELPDWLRTYSTERYYGLTHSVAFGQGQRLYRLQTWLHTALLWVWRKRRCPGNVHCFDEVRSGPEHYLSCDACGLMVHIARIEVGHVVA